MFIHAPPGVVELAGFWRGFTVSSVILEEVRSVKVLLSLRQYGGGGGGALLFEKTQSCCHDNLSLRMPRVPQHCQPR